MGPQVTSDVERRLADIEARLGEASPGPWRVFRAEDDSEWEIGPIWSMQDGELHARKADVDFIVHAVDDIPWLILQLRAQMGIVGAIRRWRLALEHLSYGYYSVADATLEMTEAEAAIDTGLTALAPEP